jgi:hypothetical protein
MKKIDFKKAIHTNSKSIPESLLESEERIKNQIIILDEIRDFISPLTIDELNGLERTVLAEGITDPLILWETTPEIAGVNTESKLVYVLIDGHHRYGISQKHKLDFRILIKNYPSVDEVKNAMLEKQLNRRNLTPEQISYYRGIQYNSQKTTQGGIEKTTNVAFDLAKKHGVNEKTIRRDETFALGLEKLSPTLKNQILSGDLKFSKTTIAALSKIDGYKGKLNSIDEIEKILNISNSVNEPTLIGQKHDKLLLEIRKIANNKIFSKKECELLISKLNQLYEIL